MTRAKSEPAPLSPNFRATSIPRNALPPAGGHFAQTDLMSTRRTYTGYSLMESGFESGTLGARSGDIATRPPRSCD
ncbi:hypothetical protein AVEN_227451-1 [Araneus ventricosus]|uniref:Uncharacterized protein n=1 Tax=Araneus ventricosus TaxID=182803 RepID=A0A4Y2MEZ8_ARAVE|nr:hypothetical protein AVEN_227451-1 [Araneus ventricosus]